MLELSNEELSKINSKPFGILLFYAEGCAHCESIKPIFETYQEKYPSLQFAKINTKEGLDYYKQFSEDPDKLLIPSFYVHHIAAVTDDNKYGFVGGFDGANEEELKAVCESITQL